MNEILHISRGTHYRIPNYAVTEELLAQHTLENPKFVQAEKLGLSTRKIPQTVLLYRRDANYYLFPRNTDLSEWQQSCGYTVVIEEDTTEGHKMVGVTSRWAGMKPRYKQDEAIQTLCTTSDGILLAGCGRGKTTIAIEAAARLQVTTLILVHKDFLMEQWVTRIHEMLGEQVRVGVLKGKKCQYIGCQFVIGLIPSLIRPDKYPKELFDYFGLVITDEVHRVGAEQWGEVIQLFPARRRWGLTATDDRPDGMEKVFKAHIGPVVFQIEGEELTPTIHALHTNVNMPIQRFILPWSGQLSIPRMITALTKEQPRNERIVRLILSALEAGRFILVLSDRVEHLQYLQAAVAGAMSRGKKVMLYTGEVGAEERKKAEGMDCIFGTTSLVKEGLDIPRLDTLIFATPTAAPITAQQGVGRILRCDQGKTNTPIVIDLVDDKMPVFRGMYKKRLAVYQQRGWPVVEK